MTNVGSPVEFYASAATASEAALAREERVSRAVAWLRLALLGGAAAAWLLDDAPRSLLTRGVVALALAAFVGAVWSHRRVGVRIDAHRRRAAAARAGVARTRRDWAGMPTLQPIEVRDGWPAVLARDLGLLGEQSLFRLLDVSHPALGGRRLLGWMLDDPAPRETIVERQRSVVALRERAALLLDAAAETRHSGAPASAAALAAFRAWCEDPHPTAPAWASPASRVLALLAAVAGIALVAVPGDATTRAALALVTINVVASAVVRRRLERRLGGLATVLAALRGALRVLTLVAGAESLPGRIGEVQRHARATGAVAAFAALVRLLEWNQVRYSPMGHWLLNAAVAFDVHLAAAVERWRDRHRAPAPHWLDEVADAEALLALATFALEHPGRELPAIDDDPAAPPLVATGLVHPLLPEERAVANDVALERTGDLVVVSGPNMAGKTTYLRAIGLDVLLAHAGGVVTASSMRLRRCRLRTSVRIEDDLGRGVSLFMAELRRLSEVIADARREGEPVLFLFDEILHGTNARDRRVATRAVLAALGGAGAAGLVTTHDPDIAPLAEGARARHLHFDGRVSRSAEGAPVLEFDYAALPGPAEHANALALLELLGIDTPKPE